MTYNKPEISKVDKAVSIVQGVSKGTFQPLDNARPRQLVTIGAYEADE